jgi:hypothetical protein
MGAHVSVYAGATKAAEGHTGPSGTIALLLDAGSYTVRTTAPGASWAAQTITVSATDTVSPATQDGTALDGRSVARAGVTETCDVSAVRVGEISGIQFGETTTITRTVTGLGSTISSASLSIGRLATQFADQGRATAHTETATVVDSGGDGTGSITFALSATDAQALTPDEWLDYAIRLTLASGAVVVLERGRIRIDAALL